MSGRFFWDERSWTGNTHTHSVSPAMYPNYECMTPCSFIWYFFITSILRTTWQFGDGADECEEGMCAVWLHLLFEISNIGQFSLLRVHRFRQVDGQTLREERKGCEESALISVNQLLSPDLRQVRTRVHHKCGKSWTTVDQQGRITEAETNHLGSSIAQAVKSNTIVIDHRTFLDTFTTGLWWGKLCLTWTGEWAFLIRRSLMWPVSDCPKILESSLSWSRNSERSLA